MNPLFWWILGAIVLLGLAGGILALFSRRSRLKRSEAAFARENCSPTRRVGDLWLDETNRRWTIARDCEKLMLHRYEDVTGAELVQDGEKYVIRKGILESYLGGVVLGAASAAANLGGSSRPKEKAVRSMVINITLADRACPVETMVLHNTIVRVNSGAYRKLHCRAAELLQIFSEMQGSSPELPADGSSSSGL
ncbi:MAG: hypothetical protein PUC59_03970 [Firmicutes bacterium]|nr:hypothetical protein [Bacillota bacterium]